MSLSIGLNLLPVFLTTLSEQFGGETGLSNEALGRLGAASFVGLVVGIIITGPLADRFGVKRFALWGNVLIAISLVCMSLAPTYATLLASLFFLGMGSGILDMVLSPIVAALHPERRSSAMNWLHSFYCVGAAVTILAGTVALRLGLGWRASCLILVGLPIALVVTMAPLRFPELVSESGRTSLTALMRRRWFLVALVAIFLGGATELGMSQWLPAYAELSLNYPAWMGGTALLLFSVAMAAGRMVAGAMGSTLDACVIMAWGCGLTVVLFLAASFAPIPWVALTSAVLAGFTGSCLWPTLLAVTADRYPDGGASMFGTLAAFGNAGGIFMPWLVGIVADHSRLALGLATSAIAPALMLPLVLLLKRRPVRAAGL